MKIKATRMALNHGRKVKIKRPSGSTVIKQFPVLKQTNLPTVNPLRGNSKWKALRTAVLSSQKSSQYG